MPQTILFVALSYVEVLKARLFGICAKQHHTRFLITPHIVGAGTAGTKGEDLSFLVDMIREAGGHPILVNLGIGKASIAVDILQRDVAALHTKPLSLLGTNDRGPAVTAMREAFAIFFSAYNYCDAAICIRGCGGISIVSTVFSAFPIGFPKLIVSTMTSGNIAHYVHIFENDRGSPGTGQVNFDAVFKALKSSGFDGLLTFEAFGSALPDLAAATKIWRPVFDKPEVVYRGTF